MGSKVSAPSSFMLIQTCLAEFNLICCKVDFLTSGSGKEHLFFILPAN